MNKIIKILKSRIRVWRKLYPFLFASEFEVNMILQPRYFEPNDVY
jgi:hypothetical protein